MNNNQCNISGSNLVVRVKEEQNYGKTETTGFNTIYVKSNTIKYSQNAVESQLLKAGRSPSKAAKGNVEVSGAIDIGVDNISTGFWLKQILGDYSVAADGSKFKHTFKIADSCLSSFQMEKGLLGSDINYKSVGLKANKIDFEGGGEGELLANIEVIGKNEFFSTIQSDSTEQTYVSDYAVNTKNISLTDATDFEVDDIVVLKIKKSTVSTEAKENNSIIEVADGTVFNDSDFISINNSTYQVKAISNNLIYLSRALEADIAVNTAVYNVSETNKIVSKSGNDIVLANGIKQAITAADDFIESQSKSQVLYGENFDNFDIDIVSSTGEVITASLEKFKFELSNNSEGKRLIKDKGMVGKVLDGKVSIKLDLTILFGADNARFLEEAKSGKEFDITITYVNKNGDSLKIILPQGTITPTTPEISSPSAIEATLEYKPYKKDDSEAIIFELLNDKSSY